MAITHDFQCIVPDLRYIRYFVALAEELNFRRAAKRVAISQPPFSRAIQAMERHVGAKLFNRTNRQVSLTPAGEALLPEAYRLLEQEARLRVSAGQLVDGQTSLLKIGCVTSAFYEVLPPIVHRFRAAYPKVGITLREYDTPSALTALEQGDIHVAFITPSAVQPPLRLIALNREVLVVALPASHPLAKARVLTLDKLAKEPVVICSRSVQPNLYDTVLTSFRNKGIPPNIQHEVSSLTSQMGFVLCGFGIAFVPQSIQRSVSALDGIVFRELKEDLWLEDISAVWNSKDTSTVSRNIISIITMA